MQRVGELVGIAHIRPGFLLNLRDGRRVKLANFFEHRFRQHAAHLNRSGAALFQGRVVEIGVRIGVQDLVRENRRNRSIDCDAANFSGSNLFQNLLQAVEVHGLVHHVFHHFADQGMVGQLNGAVNIFLAGRHIGKNRSQQIIGAHALNLRRYFAAALKAQQRQRAVGIPAPARGKNRREQRCLLQYWLHGFGLQEAKNIAQRKAMLLRERNVQAVVGGRGLQFEVEGDAKALAQRQPPGLVDARPKRSMDYQLHAAAFIKKALGDDAILTGDRAQHRAPGHNVFHNLLGAGII